MSETKQRPMFKTECRNCGKEVSRPAPYGQDRPPFIRLRCANCRTTNVAPLNQ